jgi:hypothetical protein
MGLITNRLNSLKDLFRVNGRTTMPDDTQYNALSPGYTTMQLRRTFGSKKRAFTAGLIRAKAANLPPTVPTFTAQTTTIGGSLSYTVPQFGAGAGETQTITYEATGLPAWLSFNTGTRVLSGNTATAGTSTIVVTATDAFGATASGQFTVTVS